MVYLLQNHRTTDIILPRLSYTTAILLAKIIEDNWEVHHICENNQSPNLKSPSKRKCWKYFYISLEAGTILKIKELWNVLYKAQLFRITINKVWTIIRKKFSHVFTYLLTSLTAWLSISFVWAPMAWYYHEDMAELSNYSKIKPKFR